MHIVSKNELVLCEKLRIECEDKLINQQHLTKIVKIRACFAFLKNNKNFI